MGADQSTQTPEEYQRSLNEIKARKEQEQQNKLMEIADRKKQSELKYQQRLQRKLADADKNYNEYATKIVKLILEKTLEKSEHNTLYFLVIWWNDRISYTDVRTCFTHVKGQQGTYFTGGRILKKMQYPSVFQEVKKRLAAYGFECEQCECEMGFPYKVYFSVTKTRTIETASAPAIQKIYVAPS